MVEVCGCNVLIKIIIEISKVIFSTVSYIKLSIMKVPSYLFLISNKKKIQKAKELKLTYCRKQKLKYIVKDAKYEPIEIKYEKEDVFKYLKISHYLQRYGYYVLAKLTTLTKTSLKIKRTIQGTKEHMHYAKEPAIHQKLWSMEKYNYQANQPKKQK